MTEKDLEGILGLHVVCADLSELSIHHFFWYPNEGMRHSTDAEFRLVQRSAGNLLNRKLVQLRNKLPRLSPEQRKG